MDLFVVHPLRGWVVFLSGWTILKIQDGYFCLALLGRNNAINLRLKKFYSKTRLDPKPLKGLTLRAVPFRESKGKQGRKWLNLIALKGPKWN